MSAVVKSSRTELDRVDNGSRAAARARARVSLVAGVVVLGVAVRLLVCPLLRGWSAERVAWSVGRSRPKALAEAAWWLARAPQSPSIAASSVVQSAAPLFLLAAPALSSVSAPLPWLCDAFFALLDVLVAGNLHAFSHSAVRFADASAESGPPAQGIPDVVAAGFLLNPLAVLSCAAHSLIGVNHVLLTAALERAARGAVWTSAGCLVALACIDRSYAVLLPPLALLVAAGRGRSTAAAFVAASVCWAALLLALLRPVYGSWQSALSALTFLTTSVDLTPNLGLFWYLHTELFDRFRPFFTAALSLLPAALIAPLALAAPFTARPHVAAALACCVHAALQQQSVAASLALHLTLLVLCACLLRRSVRRLYAPALLLCVTLVLSELMWFLWIGPGSGNANFYYFQSLLASLAFVVLTTELVKAARREHAALNTAVVPVR